MNDHPDSFRPPTRGWLAVPLRRLGQLFCRPVRIAGRQYNPFRADAFYWGKHDPPFRQGLTLGLIFQILLILAFTLPMHISGCEAAYLLPKGSGQQVLAQQVIVKKVERKKKKKFVVNPLSPIRFDTPDIEDSKILDQLQQQTMQEYIATGGKGKLGKGGGTKGGWPEGMENARVRFIRLEYAGGDWDQDMGINADHNLLVEFQKLTGFNIAESTEHIPIRQLRKFPKNAAPPFVFITGMGGISLTSADVQTLRWYCLEEGGMIFADNGGGSFNHHFRAVMRQVFPDLDWVDIANDDIIYQQPFSFPNGAPPLWHHSGNRALGLKYNGRWIVFYHQGDLNDAWKTGHSGVSPALASLAYKLGINIVNYAFNQYTAIHFGQ